MSKEKNIPKIADEIFKDHPAINEIYLTSDGQGFTNEEKAKDNARYLKDKSVKHFQRNNVAENPSSGNQDDDRGALVEEYEKLFGEKPAHNIGIAKLKEKIAAKKTDLEKGDQP